MNNIEESSSPSLLVTYNSNCRPWIPSMNTVSQSHLYYHVPLSVVGFMPTQLTTWFNPRNTSINLSVSRNWHRCQWPCPLLTKDLLVPRAKKSSFRSSSATSGNPIGPSCIWLSQLNPGSITQSSQHSNESLCSASHDKFLDGNMNCRPRKD